MNMLRSPQAESILSANNYGALVNAVINGAKPGSFSEDDKREYLKAWAQPGAITGGVNYYRAAKIGPSVAGVKREAQPKLSLFDVKVPTLVIWGEKDTALLTGNLAGLEKFVSDLTVKRIPNGSHWVVHEEPELVSKMIREFVGK
jgi:pimeloyl-ACP methyl ester carboxylesterase